MKKKLFGLGANLLHYKVFHRKFAGNRNEKTQITMNKTVYLGLLILDLSKTVMYEFWYDYIKPKYDEKAKLCYTDTDSFMVHIKTKYIYKDIATFDTLNYEIDRPLPIGKMKRRFD